MNVETTLNETATVPRPKWRVRHPKLHFIITIYFWTVIGLLPGLAMIFIYDLLRTHHVPMTPFQTVTFLTASLVIATFGILLGFLVGLLNLIAEKLYAEW